MNSIDNTLKISAIPRALALGTIAFFLATSLVAQTPRIPSMEPPPEAEVSPSGIASIVLTPSEAAERPDDNDVVAVHFVGYKNGAKMDSTYDKGRPSVFRMVSVFDAWRDSILLMRYQEKRRVWIPAHLEPKGEPAVFDLELVGIKPVPNFPEGVGDQLSQGMPPQDWTPLMSGAYTKMVEAGSGEAYPAPDDSVVVHYVAWSAADGKLFDATYYKERSTMIPLSGVMPGFSDCATQMVAGEHRVCWIPKEAVAGQWPGAPPGDLMFHLELVAIVDGEKLKQSGLAPKKNDAEKSDG